MAQAGLRRRREREGVREERDYGVIWCRSSATAAAFAHLLTRTGTFLLLPERLHHRAFHPSSHTPNLSKFAFRISTLSSIFNLTHARSPNPQEHLRSKRPRISPVRSKATSFHSHRFTTNVHVLFPPPSPSRTPNSISRASHCIESATTSNTLEHTPNTRASVPHISEIRVVCTTLASPSPPLSSSARGSFASLPPWFWAQPSGERSQATELRRHSA